MAGHRKPSSSREGERPPEDGHQRFLEALASRYRGALERFFRRRAPGIANECEDLTQEVFVRLAQRAGAEEIGRIEGYIFRTASSVLADRARRGAVRQLNRHILYDESSHALEDFSAERVLLAREQVELVKVVLARLPERERAAFVLHRFEEFTYAEIAKRLGVSVSAVEKYISRALKALTIARDRDFP